jgi:peroxiredoxin Q/BCP
VRRIIIESEGDNNGTTQTRGYCPAVRTRRSEREEDEALGFPGTQAPPLFLSEGAQNDFANIGIAASAISPDTPEQQKKFDEKYGLGFPLLCDTEHAVADAYGVWGEKSMYGKKYEGIMRSSFLIGEDGKILQAWYKVSPKDTVPKVREAL